VDCVRFGYSWEQGGAGFSAVPRIVQNGRHRRGGGEIEQLVSLARQVALDDVGEDLDCVRVCELVVFYPDVAFDVVTGQTTPARLETADGDVATDVTVLDINEVEVGDTVGASAAIPNR
jgi:hypothetical protein